VVSRLERRGVAGRCAVAALMLGGCAETPSPAGDGPGVDDAAACTQLHRAIARWQGREAQECGPDLTATIELVPLGGGQLLARRRFSPPDDRWQLEADGTVTRRSGSGAHPEWASAGFTLLPPYARAGSGQALLLVYDPQSPQWTLAEPGAATLRQGQTGPWSERAAEGPPWNDRRPWGRQLVGLADDLLLDRNLGDGSARLWRFVSDADGLLRTDPMPDLIVGARYAFRRGHRLVPLGPGRLLEWLPEPCSPGDAGVAPASCARFNVWNYTIDGPGGPRDPFATEPAAAGSWPDVGAGETIVADEASLYVWTRATGQLRVYRLDVTATDPLDRSLLRHEPQTLEALRSVDWQPPTQAAPLRHLVLVLQDGRSFDSYFGAACQAALREDGAPSACTDGFACCERMPAAVAATCTPFDPAADVAYQPNSAPACMRAKMNGGAMDGFSEPRAEGCGHPNDVACAGAGPAAGAVGVYHALASEGALADRFFQSYAFVDGDGDDAGRVASTTDPATQNLLYLTAARFGDPFSFIGSPLVTHEASRLGVSWAVYAGAKSLSRLRPFGAARFHDPDWYPYRSLEGGELEHDLATGQLPAIAMVLPDNSDVQRSEAPGHRADQAIAFVAGLARAIHDSPTYGDRTLVMLTYLTAGGHYDHVRPPAPPPTDVDATTDGRSAIHYGPRVPLLALGRFARANHVSHVQLEMSSVAVFMEWNWFHGRTIKGVRLPDDRRRYRDNWANNIGSLLDPALAVPELR
jgi:phospholipase C